jgi:hypothetical protein
VAGTRVTRHDGFYAAESDVQVMDVERLDADETPGPTSQACLLRAYVKPFLGIFRVRQLVRLDAQQIADVQVDSRVCRQQTPVSPPHLPPDTALPRAAPPKPRERALRRGGTATTLARWTAHDELRNGTAVVAFIFEHEDA